MREVAETPVCDSPIDVRPVASGIQVDDDRARVDRSTRIVRQTLTPRIRLRARVGHGCARTDTKYLEAVRHFAGVIRHLRSICLSGPVMRLSSWYGVKIENTVAAGFATPAGDRRFDAPATLAIRVRGTIQYRRAESAPPPGRCPGHAGLWETTIGSVGFHIRFNRTSSCTTMPSPRPRRTGFRGATGGRSRRAGSG